MMTEGSLTWRHMVGHGAVSCHWLRGHPLASVPFSLLCQSSHVL